MLVFSSSGLPFTSDTGIDENSSPVIRLRLASSSCFDLNRKRVITLVLLFAIGLLRTFKLSLLQVTEQLLCQVPPLLVFQRVSGTATL